MRHLAEGLRCELSSLPGITVQDLGTEHAGLVTFSHDTLSAAEITVALKAENITVKTIPRAGAFLDTFARDIPELVRASAHYYNSEDELETFLRALGGAIGAA